jgi:hypothetical protein
LNSPVYVGLFFCSLNFIPNEAIISINKILEGIAVKNKERVISIIKKCLEFLRYAILIIIAIILIAAIPAIYIKDFDGDLGEVARWSSKDLLWYVFTVMSLLITAGIGRFAIKQSERSNDINERMLKLEEMRSVPYLDIKAEAEIVSLTTKEFDVRISYKNDTEIAINIIEIGPLTCSKFLLKDTVFEIPFFKESFIYYSVFPGKTKEISFIRGLRRKDDEDDEQIISTCYDTEGNICNEPVELQFKQSIKIKYINSNDIYTQNIQFLATISELGKPIKRLINGKLLMEDINISVEK